MPALDEHTDDPQAASVSRRRPAPLSAEGEAIVAALAGLRGDMKGLRDEVRALREKAPPSSVLIGAVLFFFLVQSATTMYLVSGLLATRGVDLGEASGATKVVLDAVPRPDAPPVSPPSAPVGPPPLPAPAVPPSAE